MGAVFVQAHILMLVCLLFSDELMRCKGGWREDGALIIVASCILVAGSFASLSIHYLSTFQLASPGLRTFDHKAVMRARLLDRSTDLSRDELRPVQL